MLTVYIFCAIIGGGLILLSAFGGGDHDHGAEVGFHGGDHELSHDAEGHIEHAHDSNETQGQHAGPWLPFFSLRFWTYLIGIFGVTGLLLTFFTNSIEPTTGILSGSTGFLSGLVASLMVRWIQTHEADSTARDKDMLGLRARVTVPIHDQQLGRIRATVKGELLDILAVAEEPMALPEGSEVVIIGMENGRATVMPLDLLLEEKT